MREINKTWSIYLMGNGWMMVLNSRYRNVAKGWDVYVLMIEKA
jgi:hypothetical protein